VFIILYLLFLASASEEHPGGLVARNPRTIACRADPAAAAIARTNADTNDSKTA
jgi:hypothetical protein